MQRALVVVAARDELHRSLAAEAIDALSGSYDVVALDLIAEGFVPAMSGAERRAYHSERPIVDEEVARHAELVQRASVLVFVFPTGWWSPPPVLKAWLERVLVPGVAFTFDDRHKVRPNLHHVQAIVGVTTYGQPRPVRRWGGDGARHMLLRALRLNVPHRARRVWISAERREGRSLERRIRRELTAL